MEVEVDESDLIEAMQQKKLSDADKCLLLQDAADAERDFDENDQSRFTQGKTTLNDDRRNLLLGKITRRHYGMDLEI